MFNLGVSLLKENLGEKAGSPFLGGSVLGLGTI